MHCGKLAISEFNTYSIYASRKLLVALVLIVKLASKAILIIMRKSVEVFHSDYSALGLLLFVLTLLCFGYFYSVRLCGLMHHQDTRWTNRTLLSYADVSHGNFHGQDVMVFLHIQKTGGTTFEWHLLEDLDLQGPCSCTSEGYKCYCFRPKRDDIWLLTRNSVGWKCGIHADWTELTSCVEHELVNEGNADSRRYLFITQLRDPISRWMSEVMDVQRGAEWKTRHWCGGREVTVDGLPLRVKYTSESLDILAPMRVKDFITSPNHLAHNRQTRMLADLSLVGCYNSSSMPKCDRNKVMLASAKENLASMPFFALIEYPLMSHYVFEETFSVRFTAPVIRHKETSSKARVPTDRLKLKARKLNSLDIKLYKYAKKLMKKRFKKLRARDAQFEERFAHLSQLLGQTEFGSNHATKSKGNY